MTPNTDSVENPERPVPSEVQEAFDQTSELWRARLEWEEERRKIESITKEEEKAGNHLVEVIAQGLAGELDDPETFVEALEEVEALEGQRADDIARHLEEEPDDPCDPIDVLGEVFTDGE
jgi:hypothetical protein